MPSLDLSNTSGGLEDLVEAFEPINESVEPTRKHGRYSPISVALPFSVTLVEARRRSSLSSFEGMFSPSFKGPLM